MGGIFQPDTCLQFHVVLLWQNEPGFYEVIRRKKKSEYWSTSVLGPLERGLSAFKSSSFTNAELKLFEGAKYLLVYK